MTQCAPAVAASPSHGDPYQPPGVGELAGGEDRSRHHLGSALMRIDAHGGHVVVHVNGAKTAEVKNDPSNAEGHLPLQMHSGNVMHVMLKDIAILEK